MEEEPGDNRCKKKCTGELRVRVRVEGLDEDSRQISMTRGDTSACNSTKIRREKKGSGRAVEMQLTRLPQLI